MNVPLAYTSPNTTHLSLSPPPLPHTPPPTTRTTTTPPVAPRIALPPRHPEGTPRLAVAEALSSLRFQQGIHSGRSLSLSQSMSHIDTVLTRVLDQLLTYDTFAIPVAPASLLLQGTLDVALATAETALRESLTGQDGERSLEMTPTTTTSTTSKMDTDTDFLPSFLHLVELSCRVAGGRDFPGHVTPLARKRLLRAFQTLLRLDALLNTLVRTRSHHLDMDFQDKTDESGPRKFASPIRSGGVLPPAIWRRVAATYVELLRGGGGIVFSEREDGAAVPAPAPVPGGSGVSGNVTDERNDREGRLLMRRVSAGLWTLLERHAIYQGRPDGLRGGAGLGRGPVTSADLDRILQHALSGTNVERTDENPGLDVVDCVRLVRCLHACSYVLQPQETWAHPVYRLYRAVGDWLEQPQHMLREGRTQLQAKSPGSLRRTEMSQDAFLPLVQWAGHANLPMDHPDVAHLVTHLLSRFDNMTVPVAMKYVTAFSLWMRSTSPLMSASSPAWLRQYLEASTALDLRDVRAATKVLDALASAQLVVPTPIVADLHHRVVLGTTDNTKLRAVLEWNRVLRATHFVPPPAYLDQIIHVALGESVTDRSLRVVEDVEYWDSQYAWDDDVWHRLMLPAYHDAELRPGRAAPLVRRALRREGTGGLVTDGHDEDRAIAEDGQSPRPCVTPSTVPSWHSSSPPSLPPLSASSRAGSGQLVIRGLRTTLSTDRTDHLYDLTTRIVRGVRHLQHTVPGAPFSVALYAFLPAPEPTSAAAWAGLSPYGRLVHCHLSGKALLAMAVLRLEAHGLSLRVDKGNVEDGDEDEDGRRLTAGEVRHLRWGLTHAWAGIQREYNPREHGPPGIISTMTMPSSSLRGGVGRWEPNFRANLEGQCVAWSPWSVVPERGSGSRSEILSPQSGVPSSEWSVPPASPRVTARWPSCLQPSTPPTTTTGLDAMLAHHFSILGLGAEVITHDRHDHHHVASSSW